MSVKSRKGALLSWLARDDVPAEEGVPPAAGPAAEPEDRSEDHIEGRLAGIPEGHSEGLAKKLAEALERLDDLTRLVSDWVWETDSGLVLTFLSPRVNEVLGFHPYELAGRPLTDLPLQPNETLDALETREGRRPFRDLAVEIADRQGGTRQFLLSGLPVYSPTTGSFVGFRGTAHDVTELTRRETALIGAKEAAELANRAKSEFLATMSHELRTPLNAIIGFSEIMVSEMMGPLGNEQYKGYVGDISESSQHLLILINDILDASRIEAGQMTLNEETVQPETLIQSIQRLIAPRVERAALRLEVNLDARGTSLYIDKTKISQVLINLISNALKFTAEGGKVELRGTLAEDGTFVFQISDTGIGIASEDIPKAMAPFGQVDTRLSRKFEGTGLGLPLAKALTELHGGDFEIESQPEVGTTVTVRLPARRVVRVLGTIRSD